MLETKFYTHTELQSQQTHTDAAGYLVTFDFKIDLLIT
jgi:hypothetical protein